MGLTVTIDDTVLRKLPDQTALTISRFLAAEAEQTVNDIKMSIQQVSLGKTYIRDGIPHIASRPYDPPNVDTGTLYNSYTHTPDGPNVQIIYTDVEYAVELEFGFDERRLLPRPHVGPAMERLRARLARDAQNFGLVK